MLNASAADSNCLLPVAIDDAEIVPEVELELRVPLAHHAMQHLAERALELLPVLFLREDLVDRLERLELLVVEVERFVELVDGPLGVLQLVANDDGDRVRVLRLRRRPVVEID